ncbi:MAG: uroporphyrinogen-III synthase [Chloroflexi bacterium]|nr:uroporphyrinogen-III synthase [Chloroflexota bacterium]
MGYGKVGGKPEVYSTTACRTVAPPDVRGTARKLLGEGIDAVTFTSSSTVRNLLDALDGDGAALSSSIIVCIGPTTAATAKELGLKVDLVATQHTVEGLADALTQYFAGL